MVRHELRFWPPLPHCSPRKFFLVSFRLYFQVLNDETRAAVLTPPPPWRSVSKRVLKLKLRDTSCCFDPPPPIPFPWELLTNDGVGVFKYQLVARLVMFNVQLRNLFQNSTVVVFHSVRAWHMYNGSWQECWLTGNCRYIIDLLF